MSDVPQPPESSPVSPGHSVLDKPVTPLRCLVGAVIAGALAIAMYSLTSAIALSFATHKIQSSNMAVQRISAAVRTLVVGLATMGTGIFSLAAIGLVALAIQLVIQRFRPGAGADS